MIHDARVLQDDFIPEEVVHRHREMSRLSAALEPVVDGGRPEDALLSGPSGAGKTCIARYALAELQREVLDVETQYVDCWQHSNHYRILYKLLEGVETTHDVHQSTPKHELLDRLERLERPYVVILDEADQVADDDVLRELYGVPHLSTILIANRERDVLHTLDERLQSRLRSSLQLRFDAYSGRELVAILADRVAWGLDPDAVTRSQLERVADHAAGDARDAIGIIRSAARMAVHEGTTEITDAQIAEAVPAARDQRRRSDLRKLDDHQRALYRILDAEGKLSPGELFARYRAEVDDPRTKRTVRSYLGKLEHYNLVEGSGSGPSREYRALPTS
jgi:Cdc6-like AAA superfamily ATPase